MKQVALFFLLLSSTLAFSQDTKRYFGTSTNNLGTGGIIALDITFNPDGSIVGFVDNDPYPSLSNICGMGDISGQVIDNKVELSYISYETDPGCNFSDGITTYYHLIVSPDYQILSGSWNTPQLGQYGDMYLRTEQDCANLQLLQAIYQAKRNTNEGLYAKQYLCLAQKSCQEFNASGEAGWAGGFVKYMFDWMSTHNQGSSSLDVDCFLLEPKEECFFRTGMYHLIYELSPAFFDYCTVVQNQVDIDRWTNDHESFLLNAVDVCFDELIISDDACTLLPPSLCALYLEGARESTKVSVRSLRNAAQIFCKVSQFAGTIDDFASLLPAPITKSELFSNKIDSVSAYSVSTNSYALKVGSAYQLKVLKNDSGQITDITDSSNGTIYTLNVSDDIASISDDGMLTIKATNFPLANSRFPLYVYAKNNNKVGIGQFAIYDSDSDNDLVVNSYETKIGLNPSNKNGFNKDTDNDGLHDFFEVMQRTNPKSKDSDADGFVDPYELGVRSDPLDPNSTPISLDVDTLAVIDNIKISSIYPNPFNEYVVINFDVFEDDLGIELEIIDLTGKIIFQNNYGTLVRGYYSNEFNFNLSKGHYIVVFRPSKGNPVRQKIIKQ